MTIWMILWTVWIVAFVVIEGAALARKRSHPDTLSEHVWWLRAHVPGGVVIVAGFCVWLLVHFTLG